MNPLVLAVMFKIKIKEYYKKKQFVKKSCTDSSVHIGQKARCDNQTGHKENLAIGQNSDIDATISVQKDGKVVVGNHTTIRYDSFIGAVDRIQIGSYVIISNNVHIYDNNNHPVPPEVRHKMCEEGFYNDAWKWEHSAHRPVVIEDDVWIGERATILKGVTIGRGSVIGCDSVVTKDVPPYSVAAGNPARVLKMMEEKDCNG